MTVDDLQKRIAGGYAAGLGMRFTLATPELVRATMLVEARHSRSAGVMHGGAIMTFADTLGGAITMMNLPAGRTSTTVESKTNFLRPGEVGTELEGECVALHLGRRTLVCQSRITEAAGGRLVAIVTQTQLILEA